MRHARAHELQLSGPTVHCCTVTWLPAFPTNKQANQYSRANGRDYLLHSNKYVDFIFKNFNNKAGLGHLGLPP